MAKRRAVFDLKDGQVELTMEGFTGRSCEKAAQELLKAAELKQVGPAQLLPEYYEQVTEDETEREVE